MLRVGLIGCGKIADDHLVQIAKSRRGRLAGTCDAELLMARQAGMRYGVSACFDDVAVFLREVRPDVVHITTPPQGHFDLARICLEHGCHIYVEKPFMLTAKDTQTILRLAAGKQLKVTVGHNAQFSRAMLEMRRQIAAGALGGDPVHIESYYCYNIENQQYARALLGDKNHWVRRLPGGLIQNIISHGISKITEFMKCDDPVVLVSAQTSPVLKSIGESGITDELRVVISDRNNLTAYFTFSSQIKPAGFHHMRLYGPSGGLTVDHNTQTVVRQDGVNAKSYLNCIIPPWRTACRYGKNALRNLWMFMDGRLNADFGMFYLIDSFYESIETGGRPPVEDREILLTAVIMDRIIEQMNARCQAEMER